MTTAMTVGTIETTAAVVTSGNPFNTATLAGWIAFCDVKAPTQATIFRRRHVKRLSAIVNGSLQAATKYRVQDCT